MFKSSKVQEVDLRSSSVTTRPFVIKLPIALAAPDGQKFKRFKGSAYGLNFWS